MSEKAEEAALLEWWWGRLPNMDPHAAAMVEELLRALGQVRRTPQPVTPADGEVASWKWRFDEDKQTFVKVALYEHPPVADAALPRGHSIDEAKHVFLKDRDNEV